jgi:hypothetical protein
MFTPQFTHRAHIARRTSCFVYTSHVAIATTFAILNRIAFSRPFLQMSSRVVASKIMNPSTILKHQAQVVLSFCTPLCCCKAVLSNSLSLVLGYTILHRSTFQPQTARGCCPPQRSPSQAQALSRYLQQHQRRKRGSGPERLCCARSPTPPHHWQTQTFVARPSPRPLCLQTASWTGRRAKARAAAARPAPSSRPPPCTAAPRTSARPSQTEFRQHSSKQENGAAKWGPAGCRGVPLWGSATGRRLRWQALARMRDGPV